MSNDAGISAQNGSRAVLHIDMNAFYCSCHAAQRPDLYSGRPTAVAGNPETRHGVVVTASYPARRLGVRATMTTGQALRMCPDLLLIEPDFDLYRAYSRRVFALVNEYTPQVEVFSIDECWADVTGSGQFGAPEKIAAVLQERVLRELGLPCSIGVGANKFLAKMASDMKKPLGITIMWQEDVSRLLWPMQIHDMFGVGAKTSERLRNFGIVTIGQLAQADPARLAKTFGKRALDLVRHANGQDDSLVMSERAQAKSIGKSITLARDTADAEELKTVLMHLADQVGRRLRRRELCGRTVSIAIRYANRKTVTRALTLEQRTDLTEDIYATAVQLFCAHWLRDRSVRLLGVSISQLQGKGGEAVVTEQLSLFPGDGLDAVAADVRTSFDRGVNLRRLTQVVDALRDKFGEDAILRGRMIKPPASTEARKD